MPEPNARALISQQLDRRLDQDRTEAVARDQRSAGLASRQQRFAHHRAGKPGGALGRIDVQRRE